MLWACAAENEPEPTGITRGPLGASFTEIHDLTVTPASITPDGNGVFDEAWIRATARVRRDTAMRVLVSRGFAFELRWTVEVLATGRGRPRVLRSWSGEAPVGPDGRPDDPVDVPIDAWWNGRHEDGAAAVAGEYAVRVEARLAMRLPRAHAWAPFGPPAEALAAVRIAAAPDAAEAALLEAQRIREAIGRRPEGAPIPDAAVDDGPYLYEVAEPPLLADLSRTLLAAGGTSVEERFEELRQDALASPDLLVQPDAEMIEAWRQAFVASGGRVAVEWSAAGTPALIVDLDAGLSAGTAQEIADAYLSVFGHALRSLFGMGAADELAFREATATGDGAFSAVAFDHLVQARIPDDGPAIDRPNGTDGQAAALRVAGDQLVLHVRHVGLPAETGRVVQVSAHWNRVRAPVVVRIDSARAAEAAAQASGLAEPEIFEIEGPVVVFPDPLRQQVRYTVWLTSEDQVRYVNVDGVTGDVLQVGDGVRRSRIVHGFHPLSFPAGGVSGPPWHAEAGRDMPGHCAGLPFADVRGADGRITRTNAAGVFDAAAVAWPVTVGFDGPQFTEWRFTDENGALYPKLGYVFHDPAPLLIMRTGPTGGLGTPASTDPGASTRAKRRLDGMMYTHINYVRDLIRQAGIGTSWGDINFTVEWPPKGKRECTVRGDCVVSWPRLTNTQFWDSILTSALCDPSTNRCTIDHWYDFDDGDGNNTCNETDLNARPKDCEPGSVGQTYYCDTTIDRSRGWCDWGGVGAFDTGGGTNPAGCYNFVQRRSQGGLCFGVTPGIMRCEAIGGCVGLGGVVTPLLGPTPWGEASGVAVAVHEILHAAIRSSGWLDRAGGWGGEEHGRLSGFLSEALPDAAFATFYDDSRLWHDPGGLASRIGGDPVGGANYCPGGPERDDPWDTFSCPENPVTCGPEQRCAVRDPDCDGTAADPCPRQTCEGDPKVRCHGSAAYRFEDIHHHGGWLPAWFSRYGALAGRKAAIEAFACLLAERIDTNTVIARGTNSVYYKLVSPKGSCAAATAVRSRAYEAYRAMRWTATGSIAWQPTPLRILTIHDDSTNGLWRGAIAATTGAPWHLGVQRVDGWLGRTGYESPTTLGIPDQDVHAFHLFRGRQYEVRVSSGRAHMPIHAALAVPPADPESGLGGVVTLLTAAPTATATLWPTSSGLQQIVISRDPAILENWGYQVVVTLVGDDHPDADSDAVMIPPATATWPVLGEIRGVDRDVFRVFVPGGETVRVAATSRAPTIGLGSPVGRLAVRDPLGASVGDCSFGSLRFGRQCRVDVSGTGAGAIYFVSVAGDVAAGMPYQIETSSAVAGRQPGLGCRAATMPPPLPSQCHLAADRPLIAGVMHGPGTEHLWFYGREGRTYALRVWFGVGNGTAFLHHPTRDGTNPDPTVLFELTPGSLESWPGPASGPPVTFEAPLTGWYRVRIVGLPPAMEFGLPYPMVYAVQWGEGPARMPDFPEILEWAGGAVPGTCAP